MTAVQTADAALAAILAAARMGVELRPTGDRIRFRPRLALPADLVERLRNHKPAILAALNDPAGTAARIIESLRGAGQADLAEDLRECWDERMAICTIDGGLDEAAAARVALEQLLRGMALDEISTIR